MSSDFKGTGGPPPTPAASGNTGNRNGRNEYGLIELVGGKEKKVTPFMLKPDSSVEITTLDGEDAFKYTVRLHSRFKANGNFNNHVVCISDVDDRGCPLCVKLGEKGKWFACGTVLDGSEWKIPSGKRAGDIITHQRRLLLINNRQYKEFKTLEKLVKGLRGQAFTVIRSDDKKSARIGTQWVPTGKLSQADLIEKYSKAANQYGLTPENYVLPLDYEKVLAPKSFEELTRIAATVVVQKDGEPTATVIPAEEENSDETVPF